MRSNQRPLAGYLSVVEGPDKGKQIRVTDHTRVGRDASLELEISDGDTGVHRKPHCAVFGRDGVFRLISYYESGTRVNGRAVQDVQLDNGDVIEIGYRTKIRFSTEPPTGNFHFTNPDTPTRY